MKIKEFFSSNRINSFMEEVYYSPKPIENKVILNLITEKLNKFGLTASERGIFKTKAEVSSLSQMMILGNRPNKKEIKVFISEKLFHEINEYDLECQLAIAVAESKLLYKVEAVTIGLSLFLPLVLLVILNMTVSSLVVDSFSGKHLEFFYLLFISIAIMGIVACFFILEGLKQFWVYISAIRDYNIKLETIVLLKENYFEKSVKSPVLRLILKHLRFLSLGQMHKLKNMLEDGIEFNNLYILKSYIKNPFILINVFTMLIVIVISLHK